MKLTEEIIDYIEEHCEENYELLLQLAQIPAPANAEQKRAEFCKAWLEAQGAKGVYIDEALNVVYPVGCEGDKPIAVFAAHSDVVFPDMEPLPLKVEDGYIHCPGIGDDTGNVVARKESVRNTNLCHHISRGETSGSHAVRICNRI